MFEVVIGTSQEKRADGVSAATPTATSVAALVVYRPLVRLLVAALGALLTHQAAYLLSSFLGASHSSPVIDHSHLAFQWALVTPVAVVGGIGLAIWQLRVLGFRSIVSAKTLSVLVAIFFLIQEGIEATLSGFGAISLLTNPAVILGLLLTPIVAWVLTKLLQGVTEFAAYLLGPSPLNLLCRPTKLVPVPARWNSATQANSSRPRAPPSQLRN